MSMLDKSNFNVYSQTNINYQQPEPIDNPNNSEKALKRFQDDVPFFHLHAFAGKSFASTLPNIIASVANTAACFLIDLYS
ncbi:hypothetical protein [Vibrio campbellii]|uniref:hypothetical protein n=1 Tax=Vibrio campbellii TaxID=680 RepID=UPI003736D3E2